MEPPLLELMAQLFLSLSLFITEKIDENTACALKHKKQTFWNGMEKMQGKKK